MEKPLKKFNDQLGIQCIEAFMTNERHNYFKLFYRYKIELMQWLGQQYVKHGRDVYVQAAKELITNFAVMCIWNGTNRKLSFRLAKWYVLVNPNYSLVALEHACIHEHWELFHWIVPFAKKTDLMNFAILSGAVKRSSVAVYWLLSHYTPEEFWSPANQYCLRPIIKKWTAEVTPRRQHFMTVVAPELMQRLQN